ncbi:MAG TPA: C2 family cysteine protease, partial [Humisphaera sp.]
DDVIFGGIANDAIDAGTGADTVDGEAGADTIRGGTGSDKLIGGDGNDVIDNGGGFDTVDGGAGDDRLVFSTGLALQTSADFRGGAGTDSVSFVAAGGPCKVSLDDVQNDGLSGGWPFSNVHTDVEEVFGSNYDDVITGNAAANVLHGMGGNDTITGGGGNDTLGGDAGNDTLLGGDGDDKLSGDAGDDVLKGEAGNDTLAGGAGNDRLFAGTGINTLSGGDGADTLVAINGLPDVLHGDAGNDSLWGDFLDVQTDASAWESAHGHVHKLFGFSNGAPITPLGQNIADPDPTTDGVETAAYKRFADRPLFAAAGPTIDDVRQGMEGTCYFLAGLAAVARINPDQIRQAVVEMGDGTFVVRLYDGDTANYYRLDADLPVRPSDGSTAGPVYARFGKENSIWVAMLEKAHATHNGDYDEVDGGHVETPYEELALPLDTEHVPDYGAGSMNAVASDIAAAVAAKKAISVSTVSGSFNLGDKIVKSHVYTLVSINTTAKTVTLRNPWASDAGYDKGGVKAWVQGPNDGYVTFGYKDFFDNFSTLAFAKA